MSTDTRQLIRQIKRLPGWSVRLCKRGHYRIAGPRGALVFIAGTPSDSRSVRNARAELRRRGARL